VGHSLEQQGDFECQPLSTREGSKEKAEEGAKDSLSCPDRTQEENRKTQEFCPAAKRATRETVRPYRPHHRVYRLGGIFISGSRGKKGKVS